MVDYLESGTGSSDWIPPAPSVPGAASSPGGFDTDYGGAYVSGAGSVLSFIGQLMSARQAKRAAEYNAQVASRNAQAAANAAEIEAGQHERQMAIAAQDILLTRQAQQWQEAQQRIAQEYTAGQTRAIVGASGLMMRGSPLAAYEFGMQQQEKAILAGRYTATLRERALEDERVMQRYAADVARYGAGERLRIGKAAAGMSTYEGDQRAAAMTTGAFGSLIAGGAKTYAQVERAKAKKKGVSLLYEG
jgi:hypothetical protein